MAKVQNHAVAAATIDSKKISVFSEKLGANMSIELEENTTGFSGWVNGGWANWGAICN